MSRKNYMQCRRRCKRLRKAQLKIERSLVALDHAGETDQEEAREKLIGLREKSSTLMELLQLDAWEARQQCMANSISLPPPKKSEGHGFHTLAAEDRQRLRRDLEAMTDTDAEALVAQGGG
ncbi:hypothetical protein [Chromohalobacter canadensis]|uniref:Uncharacterized protein n=1 Tax=Chromohalobacter canadensis TaxID=141389 RepID=A0ABZ0Y8W3_9GAMM|nr:hypothetical protein [Chromohalobacter canadensis]MCK0767937.1 hypothetical protein [Chromohalobacter canadensis]WQH08506.1 hypothetical protein SR908_13615 [Chromohalobacter canadensis]